MTSQTMTDFLRQLPGRVEEAIGGLSEQELHLQPNPQEWSIIEVCGHLRDAIEIEGLRIRAMLSENNATLPSYNGDAYARERLYNYDDSVRVLAALRAHCVFVADTLASLRDADWQRTGTHEEAGPVSVASRANGLIEHGTDHLEQIRGVRQQLSKS